MSWLRKREFYNKLHNEGDSLELWWAKSKKNLQLMLVSLILFFLKKLVDEYNKTCDPSFFINWKNIAKI